MNQIWPTDCIFDTPIFLNLKKNYQLTVVYYSDNFLILKNDILLNEEMHKLFYIDTIKRE